MTINTSIAVTMIFVFLPFVFDPPAFMEEPKYICAVLAGCMVSKYCRFIIRVVG